VRGAAQPSPGGEALTCGKRASPQSGDLKWPCQVEQQHVSQGKKNGPLLDLLRTGQAQQSAQQVTARVQTVETVVGNIDQYKASNQTEILFRPGQTMLSKNAKDALDTMATGVKGQRGYIIEVQGFSSGKGQTAITNSQKMAESVVRYLVLNHEIPVYRIYLVGMGNAPAPNTDETATKRVSGGRVEISLLKNDLEQLSSNSSMGAMDQQPK